MNDDCSLANKGHDTRPSGLSRLSQHRHTVRYTELSSAPFKEFWRAS